MLGIMILEKYHGIDFYRGDKEEMSKLWDVLNTDSKGRSTICKAVSVAHKVSLILGCS